MTTRPFARRAVHRSLNNAEAGIRLIPRHSRISTTNLDPGPALHAYPNHIMQTDGLINRQKFMKPILARRTNAQSEIDLRERFDGDRHGRTIVKSRWLFDDSGTEETPSWRSLAIHSSFCALRAILTPFLNREPVMAFDADSGSDLILLLFFVVVAAALATRVLLWNYVKGFLASGWSMTQGRVEFGSVEERHIRYVTYYVARIDYSYSVNNEYYSGFFERVFLRESSADRFVAAVKGQVIFIRSHPNRPERSALLAAGSAGRVASVRQFLAQVSTFPAGTTTLVISTPSIPRRTLVVISITTATRWTGKTAPPLKTESPATTMLHPF